MKKCIDFIRLEINPPPPPPHPPTQKRTLNVGKSDGWKKNVRTDISADEFIEMDWLLISAQLDQT